MGLRSRLRRWLVRSGYPVPGPLAGGRDRLLYETLRTVRPGMTVLDIGAHRGETAAAFAARGATVHAFEPNPDIYPELARAAARDPRIIPRNCAILDRATELKLHLHRDYASAPGRHSESSSLIAGKPNLSPDDYRIVPVRDVLDVLAEIGGAVDIAKIDAEGAEYAILRRLIESGAVARIGRIFVETHETIPGLAEEDARLRALIAERNLAGKINLEWM